MTKNCAKCGEQFIKIPKYSSKQWDNRKYCSKSCKGKDMKSMNFFHSQKHTIEARSKMSEALKGRPSPNKGKNLSTETREKISLSLRGAKSHLWKDGRSSNPEYMRFQALQKTRRRYEADGKHSLNEWNKLKAKYNWTCPKCKRKEPQIKLTEDHIKPLSRGGTNNIGNIQPLCQPCNSSKGTKEIIYAN